MTCQVCSSAEEQETPQAGRAGRPWDFCWISQCASGKESTLADSSGVGSVTGKYPCTLLLAVSAI